MSTRKNKKFAAWVRKCNVQRARYTMTPAKVEKFWAVVFAARAAKEAADKAFWAKY
jgi:hypothetical protein